MITTPSADIPHVAEIELVYKTAIRASDRPKITKAEDAYHILLNAWDENKIEFVEQAKVLLLNQGNRVLGICELSSGNAASTIVDVKHAYVAAMKANAAFIIMAHNHPSCTLKPSEADKRVTRQFIEAGRILELPCIDHIIVTKEGFYSFVENGIFYA